MKRSLILSMAVLIALSSTMMHMGAAEDGDLIETVFYGTVLDNETLEPIEGAFVYGYDDKFIVSSYDETDEDGNYRLDFKIGGVFYIISEAKDYEQTYVIEEVEIDTENEVNFRLVPIVMEDDESMIFGVVTDAETGEPLVDVGVHIMNVVVSGNGVYMSTVAYLITDLDGYYSVYVPSGNYTISAWIEGYDNYGGDMFFLPEGMEYEFNIKMSQWQQGVFGMVTNNNGKPLPDVVVTLEMDWYKGTNVTDENGEYEIRVPYSTTYTLSCHKEGFRPHREQVELLEEMVEVDVELTKSVIPNPILQVLYFILALITG